MDIAKSSKVARAQAGMSTADLAEKMGVSAVYINQIENRQNFNSTTIENLARVFGIKDSEFVALGETKDSENSQFN